MIGKKIIFKRCLTNEEKAEKANLLQAYGQFFKNISFARGWARPPFVYQDIKHLLDEAADIVVRIRTYCKQSHEMRTQPIEGAGVEFLYTLHEKPSNEVVFVNDLVHATFSDANGYVAPLDESLVTRYIEQIRKYKEKREKQQCPELVDQLSHLHTLFDVALPELIKDENAKNEIWGKVTELTKALEQIIEKQKQAALAKEEEERRKEEEEKKKREQEEVEGQKRKELEEVEAQKRKEAEEEANHSNEESDDAESSKDESDNSKDERQRMKESIERSNQEEKKLLQISKIQDQASTIKKDVENFEEVDLKRLEQMGHDMALDEQKGLVERLQKRALIYANQLENELLALDAINGDEVRPKRKETVKKIQEAIGQVERLQTKLRGLHSSIMEEVSEKESVEEQKQEKERALQVEEEKKKELEEQKRREAEELEQKKNSALLIKKPTLKERFASLKLDPRFAVKDLRDRFIISAYIPGIDEKELKISVSDEKDVLIVEGRRIPSEKDIEVMKFQLRQRYGAQENEDELLLRLAIGRFGSFVEKWKIDPNNVDVDEIEASYQKGVLELVVPKQVANMPQRFQPNYPGYGRTPFYW